MQSSLFKASPFSLVADPESARHWAGRSALRLQLERIVRAWGSRADSSLDVMWANLGCGKTHALLHIAALLNSQSPRCAWPVFVELPENIKNFRELYERIVGTLPLAEIMQSALGSETSLRLQQAARAYLGGGALERQLVREWISCQKPMLRDLRTVTGIASRIETDPDAQEILSEILRVLGARGQRVVFLLDEFQRLAHLQPRARDALMSHLRGVFSSVPTNFSVVLAFGTRIEATALELVPAELRTLMGIRQPIALPDMDVNEAKQFFADRLTIYRPEGYAGPQQAPFDDSTIDAALDYLASRAEVRLIPRTILQTFGVLYDEIELTGSPLQTVQVSDFLATFRWERAGS
jgi:hypothetical protein